MNDLREKIQNISVEMRYVTEDITALEDELAIFSNSPEETDEYYSKVNALNIELDSLEREYWRLKALRDKYVAWGN